MVPNVASIFITDRDATVESLLVDQRDMHDEVWHVNIS